MQLEFNIMNNYPKVTSSDTTLAFP